MKENVIQEQPAAFERYYTVKEVAALWNIGDILVRKLFKGRVGVLNVASGVGRPTYRIPASAVIEVLIERGYTREQAEAIFHRGAASAA